MKNATAQSSIPTPQPLPTAQPRRSRRSKPLLSTKLGRIACDAPVVVYEALRPLTCGGCQQEIHPGERFTRRVVPAQPGGALPCCRQCQPFTERTAELEPDAARR